MNDQEVLKALLDGHKLRQVNWLPGDYIKHWVQTWVEDEQTNIPIYEPKAGIIFYNKIEDSLGLITEEEAKTILSSSIPWIIIDDSDEGEGEQQNEST